MTDRTKVMIAIAGTALVVGGATAVASGGKGSITGSSASGSAAGTASGTAPGTAPSFAFGRGLRGSGPGPGFRAGPRDGLHGDGFGAAAGYLGLTKQQLAEQLAAGKTLAQIAAAQSGKSVDGLKAAIKAEAKSDVDADVAAGRVTPAERDAFLADLDARVTAFVDRAGFPAGHGPGGRWHHGGPLASTAVAKYLGLTPIQIAEQLRAGKSLAGIAAAQKKTVAGLEAAMLADAKTHLDREVAAGHATPAQAAKELDALKSKLDAIVQNKGFPHPEGRFAHPEGKTAAFRGIRA